MPRRNPKNRIVRKVYASPESNKTRYTTKQQAKKVAQEIMLLNPNLKLEVYQNIDLGWYLTSRN